MLVLDKGVEMRTSTPKKSNSTNEPWVRSLVAKLKVFLRFKLEKFGTRGALKISGSKRQIDTLIE